LAKQFEENKGRLDAYQKKKDDHQKRLQDWQNGNGEFSEWKGFLKARQDGTLTQSFWGNDGRIPDDGKMCWGNPPGNPDLWRDKHAGGGCAYAATKIGLHKGDEYRQTGEWQCCKKVALTCWNSEPECARPKNSIETEQQAYEAAKPIFTESEPALDNTSHTVMCCNQPISVDVANAKETNLDNIKSACNFNSPLPPSSSTPSETVVETEGTPWWYWALGGVFSVICVVALIIMVVMFGGGRGRRH